MLKYDQNRQTVPHFIFVVSFLLFNLYVAPNLFSQFGKNIVHPDTSKILLDSVVVKQKLPKRDTTAVDTLKLRRFFHFYPAITRQEMDLALYEEAGDILDLMPGFFLYDLGSAGQKLLFSQHGSSAKQSVLYLDGRRFYEPIYGEADLNFIQVEFIEQINIGSEFSPLTAGYDETVFFQTGRYQNTIPVSKIYHHRAGLGFSDVDFSFGQRVSPKMNILVGGAIKSNDGKNSAYIYEHENLRAKIGYFYSSRWRFEYSALQNKINRDCRGAFFNGSYNTPAAKINHVRFDHTLNISGRIFDKNYSDFQMNLFYSSIYSKLTDNNFAVQSVDRSKYAGANLFLIKSFGGQQVTLGANFEYDKTEADVVGDQSLKLGKLFLMDEWNFQEKFGLSISAGQDYHDLFSPLIFGGINSYLSLGEKIKLTAGAKQSNRFPTLFELYAANEFIGNPQLDPERQQKIYGGLGCVPFSKLKVTSSFYQKNIDNYIQIQTDDTTSANFANSDYLQYWGMEFLIDFELSQKIRLYALINILNNDNLQNLPNLQLLGYLQYQDKFFKKYMKTTVRFEGFYSGSRFSSIAEPYQITAISTITPEAFILNTQTILDFGKLDFLLSYENILNKEYELVAGYPMRGRSFHFGLRWLFLD